MKFENDELYDISDIYDEETYCQCGESLCFAYRDDDYVAYCCCGLDYRATVESVRISVVQPAEKETIQPAEKETIEILALAVHWDLSIENTKRGSIINVFTASKLEVDQCVKFSWPNQPEDTILIVKVLTIKIEPNMHHGKRRYSYDVTVMEVIYE
jgi:hypothetical protein